MNALPSHSGHAYLQVQCCDNTRVLCLQEYDEVPLSGPLAVLECLLASALTFALLGLPLWFAAWRPLQGWLAALWVLQQLWVVLAFGCTSLFARALSIYATQVRAKGPVQVPWVVTGCTLQPAACGVACASDCSSTCFLGVRILYLRRVTSSDGRSLCARSMPEVQRNVARPLFHTLLATNPTTSLQYIPCCAPFPCMLQGEFSMRPSCWRLLAAVGLDALLVAGVPLLGALATLSCRLLTEERQSFGERMFQLQPMREVVRPMHFSPYSPARVGGGSIIGTDDEDDE